MRNALDERYAPLLFRRDAQSISPAPAHPETAVSLTRVALLYQEQGKYEQAEVFYRRACAIFEQLPLGQRHPKVLQARKNYTTLFRQVAQRTEIEQTRGRERSYSDEPSTFIRLSCSYSLEVTCEMSCFGSIGDHRHLCNDDAGNRNSIRTHQPFPRRERSTRLCPCQLYSNTAFSLLGWQQYRVSLEKPASVRNACAEATSFGRFTRI